MARCQDERDATKLRALVPPLLAGRTGRRDESETLVEAQG